MKRRQATGFWACCSLAPSERTASASPRNRTRHAVVRSNRCDPSREAWSLSGESNPGLIFTRDPSLPLDDSGMVRRAESRLPVVRTGSLHHFSNSVANVQGDSDLPERRAQESNLMREHDHGSSMAQAQPALLSKMVHARGIEPRQSQDVTLLPSHLARRAFVRRCPSFDYTGRIFHQRPFTTSSDRGNRTPVRSL